MDIRLKIELKANSSEIVSSEEFTVSKIQEQLLIVEDSDGNRSEYQIVALKGTDICTGDKVIIKELNYYDRDNNFLCNTYELNGDYITKY